MSKNPLIWNKRPYNTVKTIWTRLQSMVHHCIYPLFIFDLDLGVVQNTAHHPLHHVTYAAAKFEVALSNGFRGYKFTRKYIIWPWNQGHMKYSPVPSTSWDCLISWLHQNQDTHCLSSTRWLEAHIVYNKKKTHCGPIWVCSCLAEYDPLICTMNQPTNFWIITADVLKIWTLVACQKTQTNSTDPDQTASEEAVWSWSVLFAILKSMVNSNTGYYDKQQFIWNQKRTCLEF